MLNQILGPNRSNAPRSRAVWVSGSARASRPRTAACGCADARPQRRVDVSDTLRNYTRRGADGGNGCSLSDFTHILSLHQVHLQQRPNTRVELFIELSNAERQQHISNTSSVIRSSNSCPQCSKPGKASRGRRAIGGRGTRGARVPRLTPMRARFRTLTAHPSHRQHRRQTHSKSISHKLVRSTFAALHCIVLRTCG